MDSDQLTRQTVSPLLLVPDSAAASRWEAVRLGANDPRSSLVAIRPQIATPAGALERLCRQSPPMSDGAELLAPIQSATLWQQIVADSPQGASLIGTRSSAAAAAQAWRQLHQWGIAWRTLRPATDDSDFVALLDWCREYDRRLRRERWLDPATVAAALASGELRPPLADVTTALPQGLPPVLQAAFERAAVNGALSAIDLPGAPAAPRLLIVEDSSAELREAARWLEARLRSADSGPYALIVPDTAGRRAEIEAIVGDVCSVAPTGGPVPLWFADGHRLTEFGAPAAAINALELIFGAGTFASLSQWLRSPFFAADDESERSGRSLADAELRTELISQRSFADAMRRAGLGAQLARHGPRTLERLRGALRIAEEATSQQLPTEWIACWEKALRALGWQPTSLGTTRECLAAWDRALQSFAGVSPILGRVTAGTALAEFRSIATALEIRAPMPLDGVHVFERPSQVGPAYAGIWLCGFTDRQWPPPMRLAPLLPARLQQAHGMPYATPGDAHRRALADLTALLRSGREVVLSAPAEVDGALARPSKVLGAIDRTEAVAGRAPTGYVRRRLGARRLTHREDPIPRAGPQEVSGGTRLLELQANCPVRAFCEVRLGAKPLERIRRGLTPQVRGVALHRALELLFRPLVGQGPAEIADLRPAIRQSALLGLRECIPWSDPPWDVIVELEAARAGRAIGALLDHEAKRETIEIDAVEERLVLDIDGHSLRGRLDRVDRLSDGRVVIVDYKTGQAPSASGWYGDRLMAPQLPAYAVARENEIAGFVVAAVRDERIECRAAGDLPDDYPVRAKPAMTGAAWHAQLERWRGQVSELIGEFANGDVRIDADHPALADGDYAPLTRLYELIQEHSEGSDD